MIYRRPFSGHYFEIHAGTHVLRSRSLWDEQLPALAHKTHWEVPGPSGQRLLLLRRSFDWHGSPIELRVAEDISVLKKNTAAFQRHLLVYALIAVLLLLVLQAWVVRYGLQPLLLIRNQLRQLEQGEIDRVTTNVPREILPLVEEINRLVDLVRQRLNRSRHALGDLAHALKTPLAALGQILDRQPPGTDMDQARMRLQEIERRIEHELARARTAGRAPGGKWANVYRDLCDITRLIELAHPKISVHLAMDDTLEIAADREDMLEIFGNLLDNAAKWARTMVRCSMRRNGSLLLIEVEDDGPGMTEDMAARVLQRGARADESKPGHGLGLAIVNEIVDAYEGRLHFGRSASLGGLKVCIELPQP